VALVADGGGGSVALMERRAPRQPTKSAPPAPNSSPSGGQAHDLCIELGSPSPPLLVPLGDRPRRSREEMAAAPTRGREPGCRLGCIRLPRSGLLEDPGAPTALRIGGSGVDSQLRGNARRGRTWRTSAFFRHPPRREIAKVHDGGSAESFPTRRDWVEQPIEATAPGRPSSWPRSRPFHRETRGSVCTNDPQWGYNGARHPRAGRPPCASAHLTRHYSGCQSGSVPVVRRVPVGEATLSAR
jgi:hypothetical protein